MEKENSFINNEFTKKENPSISLIYTTENLERFTQSLNIKISPNDIKELSNSALLSSIQIFNDNSLNTKNNSSKNMNKIFNNIPKSHSNSFASMHNLALIQQSTNLVEFNNNELKNSDNFINKNSTDSMNSESNKISNQVGSTNKLTDHIDTNVNEVNNFYYIKDNFNNKNENLTISNANLKISSLMLPKSLDSVSSINNKINNNINKSDSQISSNDNNISPLFVLEKKFYLNENISDNKCLNKFDNNNINNNNNNNNNNNDNNNNQTKSSKSYLDLDQIESFNDENFETKIEKKKHKRSAFAWVGKTYVGKRVIKKTNIHHSHHYIHHNYYHHNRKNPLPLQNDRNNSTTSVIKAQTSRNNSKKLHKIEWNENAKQGVHIWSDVSNTESNESCYLNDSDVLEFHKLNNSVKCTSQSKNVAKKKCNICKLVVHETCIDSLQAHVKCRITFRESANRKKSIREKEREQISHSSFVSNVNLHHWLCRKFDEEKFENKCQNCQKSYTNRFGLQTSRSIISCSWCKASYHLKCFSNNQIKLDCNFGEYNQLIVPPSWIVKSANKNPFRSSFLRSHHRSSKRHHHQDQASNTESFNLLTSSSNSTRHSASSFIVRPPLSILSHNILIKPLIVLINPKSGGKQGLKLLKKFTWLLNPRQVFDLTLPGCPKLPLYLYRNVPNLRILVGGGDGTVGWVLSVIDQIKFLTSPPSVAVLPLGTGNDLARALNWGGGYTDEPLTKILSKILESRTIKLDRWKISTQPNPDVDINEIENSENSIDQLKNDVMNNYFSLGADAHVCLEFHERREANPQRFSSRWFNILQYLEAGSRDMIKKTWKDLKDYIKLECDGKNYTDVIKLRGYHCLIFLNIPKYCSGTNPWGNSNDNNYLPQAINDGRIEVIGCFTSTLAKFQLGGNGERICQAQYIKLTTSTYIPIQIDGEPAKLCPSIIEISHKNQAFMLEHVKYNTDSPILGYYSNIHKNYEVKCILMEDFENNRKDHEIFLQKKAIYVGAICTSNLTDQLSKVRNTINLLIKNCANGFYTEKWSFLNGEEFFRISDDSDECLLDIVSSDEVVYILDESPKFSNKTYNSNFTSLPIMRTEIPILKGDKEFYKNNSYNTIETSNEIVQLPVTNITSNIAQFTTK